MNVVCKVESSDYDFGNQMKNRFLLRQQKDDMAEKPLHPSTCDEIGNVKKHSAKRM